MKGVRLMVVVAGALVAGSFATPAQALNIGISVQTPATFGTNLAPNTTTTSTGGSVTVTSVLGLTGWTLSVKDSGAGAGHMVSAGGATCAGSTSQLAQAAKIYTPNPGGYSSLNVAAQHAVTGADTTVATYTPLVTLLSSVTLDTQFTQTIGAAEILRAGCVYSMTVTWTVQ